ncbi:MAG: hypothetical protein Q8N81_03900 [bacterium]|nr:hypothetical protein [bacterium]
MPNFDIKKVPVMPASPRHSKHQKFLHYGKLQANRRHWARVGWSVGLLTLGVFISTASLSRGDGEYYVWSYEQQSAVESLRLRSLARFNVLPVTGEDPKEQALAQYLTDKKSPLVGYAGLLSRMPNWKMLVGIAHAESNLCKKTDRNNCWGIGPGSPWSYEDISQSLYHANYLLTKFKEQGMKKPETLVRTYVGYYNPNWINAVNDVVYELEQRGLQ